MQTNVGNYNDIKNEGEGFKKQNQPLLMNTPSININDFQIIESLGKGGFSTVYKIIQKHTNEFYAAKIFKFKIYEDNLNSIESKYLKSQISILSQISHPSINEFIGYSPIDFNNENHPVIITEYCRNDTLERIVEFERIGMKLENWNLTMKLINIYGIASAMSYLHRQEIIHRNLKLCNILVDNSLFPKLNGFGIAKFLADEKDDEDDNLLFGTLPFMAPEILKDKIYSKSSDVYAFAVCMYEIMTSEYPFRGLNKDQITYKVIFEQERPKFDIEIPKIYKDLIESCWNQDPKKRPSFDEIVDKLKTNREFITDDIDSNLYHSFIEFVDSGLKGISSQIIPKDQQDLIYEMIQSYRDQKKKIDENEMKNILQSLKIDQIDLNNFIKHNDIDSGAYGRVFLIEDKITKIKYAAKSLVKNDRLKYLKELKILSDVKHPSIIKLIGYSLYDFQSNPSLIIITDYYKNGSLERILYNERNGIKRDFWTNTMRLINVYGIASAIFYLHSHEIIHLDIKPDNVLVDDFIFPKICDFGLSSKITNDQDSVINYGGTPSFIAPEIYKYGSSTKKADVYAFGMLLYEIMTKKYPFENYQSQQIIYQIIHKRSRPDFNAKNSEIPKTIKKLIISCWDQDPNKRPPFEKIVKNLRTNKKFITDDIDSNRYYSYIDFIEIELNGIDAKSKINKIFQVINLDSIYKEYNDSSFMSSPISLSYDGMEKIDEDSFSNIYDFYDKTTDHNYSVTVSKYEFECISEEKKSKITTEIELLSKLKHPVIQQFFGFVVTSKQKGRKSITINECLPHKKLFDILKEERKGNHSNEWTFTNKLKIIYGIASGLLYMHSQGIYHLKLNPKNIFVDSKYEPKLGEIGYYIQPKNSEKCLKSTLFGFDKFLLYLSPEQLKSNKNVSDKCDVYSFALIVYEVLTNEFPFQLDDIGNYSQLSSKIINENYRPSFDNYKIPEVYQNLLQQCWSPEANKRPSFYQIVNDLENNEEFMPNDANNEEYLKYQKHLKQFIQ